MTPTPIPVETTYGPTLTPDVLAQLDNFSATLTPQVEFEMEQAKRVAAKMYDLPAAALISNTIVICSVWPRQMTSQTFTHNGMGRKTYSIAPGHPDKPSYLVIQNAYEYIMARGGGGLGQQETPNWTPVTHRAADIARDIVQYWAGDFMGNAWGRIGIGIIKGQVVNGVYSATPEEHAGLVADQKDMLTKIIERADNLWESNDPQQRSRIGRTPKIALQILSLDETQHPWYRSKVQAFATCPKCAEPVKADAQGCKHCSVDFADWFETHPWDYKAGVWPKVDATRVRKAAAASVESKPAPVVPPVQHPQHSQQGKR